VSSLSDTAFITTELSKTIPDYIHPQLSEVVVDPHMILDPPLNRFETIPSIGFEVITDSTSLSQAILAPSDESLTVRANIFDFPGWQWRIDGTRVSHQVASDLPVMEVELPPSANDRIITVAWSETPLRTISNYISAFSWVGALMLAFGLLVQKRKRGFVK
jgi:hypothetical protein